MNVTISPYGFARTVSWGYEEAVAKVTAALKEKGFGVLTEIDVQSTLKEKLDVEFRRYVILGACNPLLAHRALSADVDVGLLMPCNVVVYEKDDGQCVVSMVDPVPLLGLLGQPREPAAVAKEARQSLMQALESLTE